MIKKLQFVDEIKSCFYLYQILGLQYFSISNLDESPIKFKVYSACLMVFAIVQQIIVMSFWDIDDIQKTTVKGIINIIIQQGVSTSFFIGILLILFLALLSTENQKKIFLRLDMIGKAFHVKLGKKISFQGFRKKVWIKSVSSILLYLLYVLVLGSLKPEMFLFIIPCTISITTLINVPLLMTTYVDLIVTNLKLLKQCLDDLKIVLSTSEGNRLIIPKITMKQNQIIFEELVSLKSVYLSICEVADLVNTSMGKQILIYIIFTVLNLVITGYRIFISIMGDKLEENITVTVLFLLMVIIITIYLVNVCQEPTTIVSNFVIQVDLSNNNLLILS